MGKIDEHEMVGDICRWPFLFMNDQHEIRKYKAQLVRFLIQGEKEVATGSPPEESLEIEKLALNNIDAVRILDEVRKLERWLNEKS